jgi:hypothetical protein
MQMKLMLAISGLAGLVAAGMVWFGWELMMKITNKRQKNVDDAALLATAKEPDKAKQPK